MLNSNQVKELFEQEAVLIGGRDGVPLYRVRELFGDRAAGFAAGGDSNYGGDHSLFGVGDFQLPYVTYTGFQRAASFANVENIRDTVGESAGWEMVYDVKDSLIPSYILKDVQVLGKKYPGLSGWGIISEVMAKAAQAEGKRKQRKVAAV